MKSKAQLLSRYRRFCIFATAVSVFALGVLGAFAVSVNAFPESALAELFVNSQREISGALLFLPILLGSGLILLKLPRDFFGDPQIASSLNDEREDESSGRAYRNAFYVVLMVQAIVTPILVSSASSMAIWMLALTTALSAIITYIVSYAAYEWV